MAQHIWTVLCHKASIDLEDNSISLLDCIETGRLTGDVERLAWEWEEAETGDKRFPIPFGKQVLSYWVRSDFEKPEEAIARLRIDPPSGEKSSKPQEFIINLREFKRFRQRLVIQSIAFRGFGVYWLVVEQKSGKKWSVVARVPFELIRQDQAPKED